MSSIEGDRGNRNPGSLEKRLERLLEAAVDVSPESTAIFSGSTGIPDLAGREKAVLERHLPGAAIRGFGGVTGHGLEAHFTLGLALAALAVDSKAKVPVFDPTHEKPMGAATKAAIVTTVGHQRGEGVAVLSAEA